MPEHIHTDVLFQLIGDHPHAGEYANTIGQTPETVTFVTVCGADMYLLSLINCEHGMDHCYAEKRQMRLVDHKGKSNATAKTRRPGARPTAQ